MSVRLQRLSLRPFPGYEYVTWLWEILKSCQDMTRLTRVLGNLPLGAHSGNTCLSQRRSFGPQDFLELLYAKERTSFQDRAVRGEPRTKRARWFRPTYCKAFVLSCLRLFPGKAPGFIQLFSGHTASSHHQASCC